MEKGQSLSKANKGMHRFISGRFFAMLVTPILLSMLVFNHFRKKKKSAEKESPEGASAPFFISPIPTGGSIRPYDIVLSFRDNDSGSVFVGNLYHSLVNTGSEQIWVFRGTHDNQIREDHHLQFLDAIKLSKISIPIISENYASSKWCLRELITIMDYKKTTSHIVLPIFYKVHPSDVRNLKGNFGNAFRMQKKHLNAKDIKEGQKALEEVSYLNGWESEKFANRREGELIKLVVKAVLSELGKDCQLHVPKELVGLDGYVNEIMNWIDRPFLNARMIGIYGMGGIGKTTLAKCIYNQLSNKFEHASFLPDIRDTAHRYGITYLQSQLIYDIQQSKNQVFRIDDGIRLIKSKLQGEKVLILLDDINHKDQLNALAHCDWFNSESILIITTRNKAVLDQFGFEVDYKYELKEIDEMHSLILFNRHAFHKDHSLGDFADISCDIVSIIGGLPLTLEVIGSYLYGKTNQNVWKDMLKQLKVQPHRDVQKILSISYDALEDRHKEIFLDIAHFLIGKGSAFAFYLWEDCGFYPSQGIEVLKLRCLIKIGEDGTFRMHDQLRDLGRYIISQGQPLEKRSRLWVNEEAPKGLMEEKGSETMEAICRHEYCDRPFFDYGHADHLQTYTNEQFKDLRSLRFLQWWGPASCEDFCKLFSKLRWLQWLDIEPNLSFLTINLHLPKLAVLQLSYNHITEDWRGWSSIIAVELKILDLSFCEELRCTPDLSAFKKLEIIILKNCYRLEQVHYSIGKLKSLICLDLCGCCCLKELPEEVGELEELKELILDSTGIRVIPMSFGSLRKLERLSAQACRSLTEFLSSNWDLQNSQHLDLIESPIENLPSVIGRFKKHDLSTFTNLEIIILKGCYRLMHVHPSIGKVKSLVSLDLSGCGELKELPVEVGELGELKELILDFTGITEIPISIGSLRRLEKLSARACRSLTKISNSIWDLQNLQHLDISQSHIEKLPNQLDLSAFPMLEILILKDCYRLEQVRSFIGKFKNLISLDLSRCCSLKELPEEVGELEELKELILDSSGIIEIPMSIGSLRKLEKLSARACRSLREIPSSIWDLQNLQHLDISRSLIEKLPGAVGRLKKLQRLSLESCCSLEGEIPREIGELSLLKILEITEAQISHMPESIRNLSSLQHLSLWGCHNLQSLPELPSSLKYLKVSYNGPSLPELSYLIHLEKLDLSWKRSTWTHPRASLKTLET